MTIYTLDETIVAPATNSGGALALIRISGSEAMEIGKRLFSKDPALCHNHSVNYGTISFQGELIDEAVMSVFNTPHSFTGEDVIEFGCHGSAAVVNKVMEACIQCGARAANEGEFSLRAFLNHKIDLSQAEAIADLVAANSESSRKIALAQLRGGYAKELAIIREKLIEFASLIELELDFAEEDVEFANREHFFNLISSLSNRIGSLMGTFSKGNAIKEGVPIVIAGKPNAGKSTLLNALLNEDRAIVTDIPGTTRDTLEETLMINGVLFRLIDTAGIRYSTDEVEVLGIERALESIKKAQVLIYLYEANTYTEKELNEELGRLELSNLKVILVANKKDKLTGQEIEKIPESHFMISAHLPEDVEKLKQHLGSLFELQTDINTIAVVTNQRHFDSLSKANEQLGTITNKLQSGQSKELLALDLRYVLDTIGEITGQISSSDLLESIFSKFCIGK